MSKKEKYSLLMDEILEEIIRANASGRKYEIPVITKNVINLIRNLKEQVDEQRAQLTQMEDKITNLQKIISTRKK